MRFPVKSAFGTCVNHATNEDDTHFVHVLLPPKPWSLLKDRMPLSNIHINKCYTLNGCESQMKKQSEYNIIAFTEGLLHGKLNLNVFISCVLRAQGVKSWMGLTNSMETLCWTSVRGSTCQLNINKSWLRWEFTCFLDPKDTSSF